MKIRATMMHHLATVRIATLRERERAGVGEDAAIRECLYPVGGDTEMRLSCYRKHDGDSSKIKDRSAI